MNILRVITERGLSFDWLNDWEGFSFRRDYNWQTVTLIRLELEDDAAFGSFEMTAMLLGLGVRVVWHHTDTQKLADLVRLKDEVLSGHIETKVWK